MRFFLFLFLFFLIGCDTSSKKSFYTTPKLTLLGKSTEVVAIGTNFSDPGIKAYDTIDGDIKNRVRKESNLNLNRYGTYTITYSVCNRGNLCSAIKRKVRVTSFAKAGDFALANAKVEIFEIEQNGSKKLLFSQKSNQNALFDTHADGLEEDKLYLIKISQGKVLDKNIDGIKDSLSKGYKGELRLLATGKEIKEAKNNLKVSLVSELSYELLSKQFYYFFSYNTFHKHMDESAQKIIDKDSNGDGIIDNKDVIVISSQDTLKESLKYHYSDLINANIEGKKLLFNFSTRLKTIKSNFARSIEYKNGKIYIGSENEIIIVNAQNLKVEKKITLTNSFFRAVDTTDDGKILFGANGNKIEVIDMQNKTILHEINTTSIIRDVDYDATLNKLFVANEDEGLLKFSVNSDFSLSKDANLTFSDTVYKITPFNNDYLALSVGQEGIVIVDKDSLQKVSSFNTYGIARDFIYDETAQRGFIDDAYKGVVEVSVDGVNLSYKAHLNSSDYARSLVLDKEHKKLFIADTKGQVIQANYEKYLKVEKVIPTDFRAYDVALQNNKLFIASGFGGVQINTLDDIKPSVILSTLYTSYRAYNVIKNDNKVYMAQGYKGVRVFDLSNIFRPKKLNDFDTPGFSIDLFVKGEKIYVADGKEGVSILNSIDGNKIANFKDASNFFKKIYDFSDKVIGINDKKIVLLDKNDLSILDVINESGVESIAFANNTAYLCKGDQGITIYNANNWQKIEDLNISAKAMIIDKNETFIASSTELVQFNLTSKKIEKRVPLDGYINALAFNEAKNRIYIGINNKIILINRSTFSKIGELYFSGKIKNIRLLNGDKFIISAWSAGAYVVDFGLF